MSSDTIQKLREMLEEDYKSELDIPHTYPSASVFALKDNRVIKLIETRFNDNRALIGIESLPYDPNVGLIYIYFEFERPKGISFNRDTLLVILDQKTNVIGLIDCFNPDRPNTFLSNIPKDGDQPFVTSRPSNSKRIFSTANTITQSNQLSETNGSGKSWFIRCQGHSQYTTCCWTAQPSRSGPWQSSYATGFPPEPDPSLDYETDYEDIEIQDDCGYGISQ